MLASFPMRAMNHHLTRTTGRWLQLPKGQQNEKERNCGFNRDPSPTGEIIIALQRVTALLRRFISFRRVVAFIKHTHS